MEFPSGHRSHTHHHHHQRNDGDEVDGRDNQYYPPPGTAPPPPLSQHFHQPPPPYQGESEFAPPPPYYQENEFPRRPPPTQATHVYHTSHNQELDPSLGYPYQQPPPTEVTHVSRERSESYNTFRPHLPSFVHNHFHESGLETGLAPGDKPSFKVYSKADPNFNLTVRDGKVILAAADPSDRFQEWFKDEKYSTRVKDEEGCSCFALVNKATGQALKHSIGDTHPVELIPYNPDVLDTSVLWTESKDLGDGYRAIRMVNNVHLNVDAFHGDKVSGGVHDGTTIVLWQWNNGDNQRWKIIRN